MWCISKQKKSRKNVVWWPTWSNHNILIIWLKSWAKAMKMASSKVVPVLTKVAFTTTLRGLGLEGPFHIFHTFCIVAFSVWFGEGMHGTRLVEYQTYVRHLCSPLIWWWASVSDAGSTGHVGMKWFWWFIPMMHCKWLRGIIKHVF